MCRLAPILVVLLAAHVNAKHTKEAVQYKETMHEATQAVWTAEQHENIRIAIEDGSSKQPHRSTHWYSQKCEKSPLVDVRNWDKLQFTQHSEAQQALLCHQHPPDCSSAKFIVLFHREELGYGWTSYFEAIAMSYALAHNRILIEGGDGVQLTPDKFKWRWCPTGPKSHSCYYSRWSSCISPRNFSEYIPWTMTSDICNGRAPEDEQIWFTLGGDWLTCESNIHKPTGPGFFWFMSLVASTMYNPLPWLRESTGGFLSRTGLNPNTGFIVAHVRWGDKNTEQPYTPIEAYFEPLRKLSSCLGTNQVLIQTETQVAADSLLAWCIQNKLHCLYTLNPRPGKDNWNPAITGDKSALPTTLLEGGYVASLNYAIGSYGRAFVGTLHSAWGKLQVGGQIHQAAVMGRSPPLVVNLAQPYAAYNVYLGNETKFFHPHDVPFSEWRCPL